MEGNLYLKVGRRIKEIRLKNKATLADIALKAGVTKGLLSKIENGRTIPSLPVLFQVVNALNTDFTYFFDGLTDNQSISFIHKKAGDYQAYQKEDSEGFSYYSILSESIQNVSFQTFILELHPNAKREKVVTDGFTYIYVLEGQIGYELDKQEIILETGDSLFFDGKIPHVPKNTSTRTAKLLVNYLLTTNN